MNPINMLQMMRSGNPQQILQQMMGNSQIANNPMARNAMDMARRGDSKGIEQMARNLCAEKGMNADDVFNQIKGNIGI